MERIHPKQRFSQNAKSKTTPPETIARALAEFGLSPSGEARKLSGGFMNSNFVVEENGRKLVFRIYSTDMITARREFDMLKFLESRPVRVPRVHAVFEVENTPVVVMEHLNGSTLEDRLLSGEPIDPTLYEDIGQQLGQIHSIHFKEAGFIGPEVRVGNEYENFSRFIRQFIERTLEMLKNREDRLDPETNKRFRQLVQENWDIVLATEPVRQLTHCDFNPKNILVTLDRSAKVAGVIDWEFCLSGNGLIDIGNFFRFAYDYPTEARDHFFQGYRSVRPDLPQEWEDASRLLDLGNMCSFLERPEDYQESFRTARAVIKATLEHVGYA